MVASCLLAVGCETTEAPNTNSVSSRLTESVVFLLGMKVPGDLPEATDEAVTLVELGPATLLSPGGSELLAFEVTDPDGREVVATLLQFEGEDDHLRGEVEEGGGSSGVISSQLEVEDDLCVGLCDGVLSVEATVALELVGGVISHHLGVEIAVDCRGKGTEGICPVESGSDDAPFLVCDDVTTGGAALTSDHQLDAYFDALRTLSIYSEQTEEAAQEALGDIRTALGDDAQDGIPDGLKLRIDEATEAGLLVLIGDPGCGVRAPRVQHTLRVCDRELDSEESSMACSGLCEPGIDRNACAEAETTGCRGVIAEGGACDGTCIGACQVVLAEPRACVGTCIGSCDGTCVGSDDPANCEGPCTGMCDGECREPISEEVCDGVCTGMCSESTEATADDPLPACVLPLSGFCTSAAEQSLICRGDCFGAATVSSGAPICQASALAMGALSARCDAPIVQVYFAFNTMVDSDTQQSFSTLVDQVNDPLTTLLVLLDRIDLLETAATELLGAEGAVTERLASELQDDLDEESLECAQGITSQSTPWLQGQIDLLQGLRAEILAIAEVLDTTGL